VQATPPPAHTVTVAHVVVHTHTVTKTQTPAPSESASGGGSGGEAQTFGGNGGKNLGTITSARKATFDELPNYGSFAVGHKGPPPGEESQVTSERPSAGPPPARSGRKGGVGSGPRCALAFRMVAALSCAMLWSCPIGLDACYQILRSRQPALRPKARGRDSRTSPGHGD
jgi:hypothetical protein